MPIGIVDTLEEIDVDHHETHVQRMSLGVREFCFDPIIEVTPVVKAGERVPRARLIEFTQQLLLACAYDGKPETCMQPHLNQHAVV